MKKTFYIVTHGAYDTYDFDCIFEDKEEAKLYANGQNDDDPYGYDVQEIDFYFKGISNSFTTIYETAWYWGNTYSLTTGGANIPRAVEPPKNYFKLEKNIEIDEDGEIRKKYFRPVIDFPHDEVKTELHPLGWHRLHVYGIDEKAVCQATKDAIAQFRAERGI